MEDDGFFAILTLKPGSDGEEIFVLSDPAEGIAILAWRGRRYELCSEFTSEVILSKAREVNSGMSRMDLIDALMYLEEKREFLAKLKGEVKDSPGIIKLVGSLDQLQTALQEKGLTFRAS